MEKFKHFKLPSCRSTQEYLHNYRPLPDKALCTTVKQTKGRGRGTHSWDNFSGSLAFSFTCQPASILTLTSLEIAVLISDFIKQEYKTDLSLKWPNDLLNMQGQKVGGILLQNNKLITVGVGLNWCSNNPQYSSIFPPKQLTDKQYHSIPASIVEYIYNNRLDSSTIINKWNKLCFHLNKNVKITDNDNSTQGCFKGIGQLGQAIILQNNQEMQVFNGSLTYMDL